MSNFHTLLRLATVATFVVACVVAQAHRSIILAQDEEQPGTFSWMADREMADLFSGATLEGVYASGRTFTEIYKDNGRIRLMEGGMELEGNWSVRSGTFCTIYDNTPSGGCFRVARVAQNCFEFYFVARTEEDAQSKRFGKPDWTARGSIRDMEGDVCREGQLV